jgi:hypothetical protein
MLINICFDFMMLIVSLIGFFILYLRVGFNGCHDDGFPLYKRIPERALHGIVTFFAALLVFCGFDTIG